MMPTLNSRHERKLFPVSDMLLPASPAQFLKVEEEAGNPVERMANMLPRIVAADYQPLPESVRAWPHLTCAFQGFGGSTVLNRVLTSC